MAESERLKRIIVLIDMDCFYVQVEERDNPHIKGVPAAVCQYNGYRGGAIIALNYEARALGIPKNEFLRGDDILKLCPNIAIVKVPESRGKADLTKYRDAGAEVINVISEYCTCVERASIDEAFLDLTEAIEKKLKDFDISDPVSILDSINTEFLVNNFVLGHGSTQEWLQMIKESELLRLDLIRLALGAEMAGEIRKAIFDKTGFRCTAGIGNNKVLAKLVCAENKPNKQTIVPFEAVDVLYRNTKLKKVRNLGGKFGREIIEKLGCETMSDLAIFTERELTSKFGSKTGHWLFQLAKGYDDEAVVIRHLPKSIGCSKNFLGPEALTTKEKVKYWIKKLSEEIVERIEKDADQNKRRSKLLSLHITFENQTPISRACGIPIYNAERMAEVVFAQIEKFYATFGVIPVNSMGLGASKFEDELDISDTMKISNFFQVIPSSTTATATSTTSEKEPPKENIAQVEPRPSTSAAAASTSSASFLNSENSKSPLFRNDSKPLFVFTMEPSPNKKKLGQATLPSVKPLNFQPVSHPNSSEEESLEQKKEECHKCGKSISIYELEEHMDFHFAKELSREINGSSNSSNPPPPPPPANKRPNTSKGKGPGGKRGKSSKKSPKKLPPMRRIDSYFNKGDEGSNGSVDNEVFPLD